MTYVISIHKCEVSFNELQQDIARRRLFTKKAAVMESTVSYDFIRVLFNSKHLNTRILKRIVFLVGKRWEG